MDETASASPVQAGLEVPFAGANVYALSQEGLALWSAACEAWCDYLVQLSKVAGPVAWMEANLRLTSEAAGLFSLAAADRLRDAGVTRPLLCDA